MRQKTAGRAACPACHTAYDTQTLPPGAPFSCRHCGVVLFAPGSRSPDQPADTDLRFGEIAVRRGYISREILQQSLEEQQETWQSRRLGEILVEHGELSATQVGEILRIQGARLAHAIAGYEVVEKLGEGGMGAVYKAVHLDSGRTVAIKVLPQRLLVRPDFVQRFHREAQVAIELDHPGIVKGLEQGQAGSIHYFAMEYVHGKSASRVLRKRGRFGERRAMDIARQVARALEYADARCIVHRDIKPGNLLLTRDGTVKLADYGLVKQIDDDSLAGLTRDGQVMGTPNYMSPEQARGRGRIDIRSDIYSLGATLYHLLTGQPPFQGESPAAIMGMHIFLPPDPPGLVATHLAPETSTLVMRMLAKDPLRRPQTPRELLDELDAWFAAAGNRTGVRRPVAGPSASADDFTPLPGELVGSMTGHDLRRSAPYLLSAGIMLLATIAVLVGLMLQEKPSPPVSPVPLSQDDEPAPELPTDAETPSEEAAEEDDAARLYLEAVALEGQERIALLEKLARAHPEADAGRLAAQEAAQLRESEARRRNEEDRSRRQQRETAASAALAAADRLPEEDRQQALQRVAKDFRDTPAGTIAEQRLKNLARQTRPSAAKAEPAPSAATALKPPTEDPQQVRQAQERFLGVFLTACGRLDAAEAQRLAELLEGDERYPSLKPYAEACRRDAGDLAALKEKLRQALNETGRKPITLTFGKSRPLEMTVVGVDEDGTVRMLAVGEVPMRRPLSELILSDLEKLLGPAPLPVAHQIALGLVALGRGELERARELLGGKADPRRSSHRQMLRLRGAIR